MRNNDCDYAFPLKTAVASAAIYVDDDMDLPSDTDDEEERLDCVHDIHIAMDGDEADAEEEEEDF